MPRPRKKGRRREIKKVPRSDATLPEYDRRSSRRSLEMAQQSRYSGKTSTRLFPLPDTPAGWRIG